jgi:O-antigen/teichoic acid export membrane protein
VIDQIKSYFDLVRQEKDMVKDSFTLTFYNFLTSFLTFISNVSIAYILGPAKFGIMRVLVIFFGVFLPFLFDFGGTLTLTKYVAEFQNKKKKIGHLNRSFLMIRLNIFLLLIILAFIFRQELALFLLHDIRYVNLIYPSLLILAASYFFIFLYIVLGYENFKLYGIANSFGRFIYVILVVAVALLTGSVYYALIAYALSFFVGYIMTSAFLIRKNFLKLEEKFNIWKIFKNYSLPMHIFYLPNYLALSAVVLISPFFGAEQVGYFSWAFQFYWASTFFGVSISNMLLPKISKMDGRKENTKTVLRKIMTLYTPLAILGIVGTLLFSKTFMSIIAPDYLPGLTLFKAIMIYGFIAGYGMIYVAYGTAKNQKKKVAITQLLINAILIGLAVFFLKII